MENSNYNSLAEQLMKQGILKSGNNVDEQIDIENFFELKMNENSNNILQEKSNISNSLQKKKRLNQYDLEIIQNGIEYKNASAPDAKKQTIVDIFNQILNYKKIMQNKEINSSLDLFLYKFFPRMYKAKLIKNAMRKLGELDVNAKLLFDKTIPYGENDLRYGDLVKFLNYANEIQTRLKKKM